MLRCAGQIDAFQQPRVLASCRRVALTSASHQPLALLIPLRSEFLGLSGVL